MLRKLNNNDINEKKVLILLWLFMVEQVIFMREDILEKKKSNIKKNLKRLLDSGYNILNNNGSAVDAVETVIRVLEDSPLFNAGKGAVFTEEGNVELDASIMDGKKINAGGVASLKHIKNPITLARFVMEHSPHVLLFGDGAEKFADEFGLAKS